MLTVSPPPSREPLPAEAKWYMKLFGVMQGMSDEYYRRQWSLSSVGSAVYEMYYILGDIEQAQETIASGLKRQPAIGLVAQTFAGRGRVKADQLKRLLRSNGYNYVSDGDVSSFLGLMHDAGIITLNRRWMSFVVHVTPVAVPIPGRFLMTPDAPFANRRWLERLVSSLNGNVLWIDKHFRRDGLDYIVDWMPETVTSVIIISGPEHATRSAAGDLVAAQKQLVARCIELRWFVCIDDGLLSQVHDRWIIDTQGAYNVPPIGSIAKGQLAEFLRTEPPPWDLIQRLFESSKEIAFEEDEVAPGGGHARHK